MSIELIGLAFDERMTDSIWSEKTGMEVYHHILEDDFRRRVDLRSLLYHKGMLDLLTELEVFIKQGGGMRTLTSLLASRFRAGVEDFPSPVGEMAFDFKLIRQFASLAMADDFIAADSFLRILLKKVGFLKNGAPWSLIDVKDYTGIFKALQNVRMRDIVEIGDEVPSQDGKLSFEHLVKNYIEFLSYAYNNELKPFFYNSETDFKRWGNLTERQNRRAEMIVQMSFRGRKKNALRPTKKKKETIPTVNLRDKLKRRLEVDALVTGLSDSDPLIRQKSAESLGKLADPEIFGHLSKALSDTEPEVRQEVVRAIAATGDPRSEETLLSVVDRDESLSVALTAAYILTKRNSKGVLSSLLNAVQKGKPHFSILLASHSALLEDRASLLQLTALAASENPATRQEVAYLLGLFPSRQATMLVRRLSEDEDDLTKIHSLYSLRRSKHPETLMIARRFTGSSSEPVAQAGTIVEAWASRSRS